MIIVVSPGATPEEVDAIVRRIEETGRRAHLSTGTERSIIGVHPSPDHALSDGAQSLTYNGFTEMMRSVAGIAAVVERTLSGVEAAATGR